MSSQYQLDQRYAEVMSNHPYGVALYRPISESILRPGSVGYFDDKGDWNPICSVDCSIQSQESIAKKELSPIQDELELAPVERGIRWGPKLSSNTKATKIDLSGGIDPAIGIPLTVSAVYSYSTDSDCGGILLTSPPITHQHYYHTSPFKTWCKSNALTLLRKWPEVKSHGVWVITSTYATKKCAINMWTQKGRGFKVGFDAEAMGFGKLGPSGEWHRTQTDEGWGEYEKEGNDQSVVFFGGLKFQYTWVLGKDLKSVKSPKFRGPASEDDAGDDLELGEIVATIPDPNDEQSSIILDCEEYLDEADYPPAQEE